jgi:hypothetical protein
MALFSNLGALHHAQGELEQARAYYVKALDAFGG